MKFLADENFHRAIVRGFLRRYPTGDVVRAVDVGIAGYNDEDLLAWAAQEGRMILTHDAATLIAQAYARVRAGLPMPGVIEVAQDAPIGAVIEDLLILAICSAPDEWEGQVLYVPLQ
jgi:hypothetical protein